MYGLEKYRLWKFEPLNPQDLVLCAEDVPPDAQTKAGDKLQPATPSPNSNGLVVKGSKQSAYLLFCKALRDNSNNRALLDRYDFARANHIVSSKWGSQTRQTKKVTWERWEKGHPIAQATKDFFTVAQNSDQWRYQLELAFWHWESANRASAPPANVPAAAAPTAAPTADMVELPTQQVPGDAAADSSSSASSDE